MSLVVAAAITWTPTTFYVASAIVQTLVILAAFRMLQVDTENNSFVGAAMAAGVFCGVCFAFKDAGVIGAIFSGAAIFGMLVLVTSGEALKSAGVMFAVVAVFGLFGDFIAKRTPLTIDDIGGVSRIVLTGGLEAEPMTEGDVDNLNKAQPSVPGKK